MWIGAGHGEQDSLAADTALVRAERGELMIIDVRSRGEWMMTGVAKGATKLSIHDWGGMRGFVERLKFFVRDKFDRPIALICAQGIRSTETQKVLRAAGFTNVENIREGMFGSSYGPGWFKRGLPVVRIPRRKR